MFGQVAYAENDNIKMEEIISSFETQGDDLISKSYDLETILLLEEIMKRTSTESNQEISAKDLGALKKSYEQSVGDHYFNEIMLLNNELFTLKRKLAELLNGYISSKTTDDETKGMVLRVMYDMYQSNYSICKIGIENLNYFKQSQEDHIKVETVNQAIKRAEKEWEKAEQYVDKGLIISAMESYESCYKNVLEGYKATGITLTEEYLSGSGDTDEDGLSDGQEFTLRINPFSWDTDNDGLSDYIEDKYSPVISPVLQDTDKDGILDSEEDYDEDGLTNLQEIEFNTLMNNEDSDSDGLKDGYEVTAFASNPTVNDTDYDGLSDGDEYHLGTNPNNEDTDSNGIIDSEETYEQSMENAITCIEKAEVVQGQIKVSSKKNIRGKTIIEATYDENALVSDLVGLIGSPIRFEVEAKVNKAQIILTYDEAKLGNTSEESLGMLWYDANKDRFKLLKAELDEAGNTVSASVNHFGIYMLVDKKQWLDAWKTEKCNGKNKSKSSEITTNTLDTTDTDGDGIFDVVEVEGLRVQNGQIIKTDPLKADTDNDGLLDGEEFNISAMLINDDTATAYYGIQSSPVLSDSDNDGIEDSSDQSPYSNLFTGKLTTNQASSDVAFRMDFRTFFNDNGVYNKNLSIASSIWSTVVYNDGEIDLNGVTGRYDIDDLMRYYGFNHVTKYKLSNYHNDEHLSEIALGHKTVTYNGQTKEVVSVAVRGTNSTIEEWSSNFNVGDTTKFYYTSDWKKSTNHMGFDIPASRLHTYIKQYIQSNVSLSKSNTSIWLTGHSRGAAVANILGAKFEDDGYDTYTYTFATPNTTTAWNASSYDSIFNIVNTDDFVPYLPLWSFKRYGKTAGLSVKDRYESAWEQLTGIWDYNPDTLGMSDTISSLGAVADDRNNCYEYTCTHHGDGSSNNITIRNNGMSYDSREGAIAKIPDNATDYCIITRYTGRSFGGIGLGGWDFEVCQTPTYFMQLIAATMSGTISSYRFAVELNIADRYENAKSKLISSSLGGLAHPHYKETYYLLSNKVYSSHFH